MLLLTNKRALHDYAITSKIQAGVILMGGEVKSLRQQHGSLAGSYVKVIGRDLVLVNAHINPYPYADNSKYDPKRTRRLLLHKKQIFHLIEASEAKGAALIPLSFELVGNHIKLNIGLGKGRKEFEKREVAKKRDVQRQIDWHLKQYHSK